MSDVIKPVKVEFIESYIKGVNGSADYQWNDNHGELIRCKNCKWRGNKKKCIVAFVADKQEFPLFFYDNRGEWFCADGVKHDE